MNITEEHLSNMKKLRDYMASLPKDYQSFDMKRFAYKEGLYIFHPGQLSEDNSCGTVCCLAGHGPLAGILPESEEAKTNWMDYCTEAFGCNIDDEEGDYLFGPSWPNDISFAIRRMDKFIQYKGKIPEDIMNLDYDEAMRAHEDS